MAGVASLQLLADARHPTTPRFSFLAVALPQSGMVLDQPVDSEQDLLSTGIDFQRWLRVFAQFPITEAVTIIDCLDYPAAQDLARQHNVAAARFADLFITYGTRTIINRRLKIVASLARALPGAVTGSGTTGSPQASVRTEWRWKCTEVGT